MKRKVMRTMNDNLVIIGAGGHGRVVADIAKKSGVYKNILFLDDSDTNNDKVCVSGMVKDYYKYIEGHDFVVAIGNNQVRERIQRELQDKNVCFATLIHPNACIGDGVVVGTGSVVMAGAVINSCAIIGEGVIVNTCSSVDHDCTVGAFSHISVGAHLAGTVNVGARVFVGAGATVINNINICDDCMIGAGATVVKNICAAGVYKGVPAK